MIEHAHKGDPLSAGRAVAEAWATGLRTSSPTIRRIAWQMQEAGAYISAATAMTHADWYCALPWPRMWWAMVTGR